jgi:putative transposase
MPRATPSAIILTETEQDELQQIVNRHSSPQQLVQRAKIILLANKGQNNRQIVRSLNVSREMVRLWRQRWLENSNPNKTATERLTDADRPGAPAQFTMEQVLKLFAIACEPPQIYGYPLSHWSARELTEVLIAEQIVETISVRHVGRLLEEADLQPHKSSYWLNVPKKTPISIGMSEPWQISTFKQSNGHNEESGQFQRMKRPESKQWREPQSISPSDQIKSNVRNMSIFGMVPRV